MTASEAITWLRAAKPQREDLRHKLHCVIELLELIPAAEETAERQHHRVHQLEQEIIAMARTFVEASTVLIDHDKKATADATAAQKQVDTLTTQLADANAKAQTPEVLAAQQAVIDAAEADVPSAPPATGA